MRLEREAGSSRDRSPLNRIGRLPLHSMRYERYQIKNGRQMAAVAVHGLASLAPAVVGPVGLDFALPVADQIVQSPAEFQPKRCSHADSGA